ncbi:MAG: serine--tRNA ligase [Thaumarchaeota archaeon]|uniref:Serine--tRNA ligase n=2 Tax=Nitrososphaerota TaxID=651137 RepID=A0A7K4N3S3_9ARCH|nr:putative tRNA synthetase class II core domain (G, H, P, S and T) [uncultured marine crenarchaeote HF4000_APKG3E18]NWJ43008.1 serine--tRNA ligase [Marine Group I thaumarchaeote]NWJ77906.1 serine--tRNA ligase [Marine Group I thaumarchaeote]RTZ71089.1 MAG: serine--tRNA ligase [Nitrososphaerota archaeon]
MLDMKMIRENPENIRKMLKDRAVQFDLDLLLELDKKRREMILSTDNLRKKKNEMSIKISEAKKTGSEAVPLIQEMQLVSQELAKLEEVQHETESEYSKLALTIPNVLHKSVPCGDDSANKEIRKWGTIPQFDFEVKDHIDISENLNLLELERAAKTAGARFYYLMGDLVKLNQSLIQFGLDFLSEKGYTMSQPPYMINRKAMEGAVILDDFEDVIYKIEDQDLYLIGTSEHAMVSMYADEILDGNSLPARYSAISPCFRKEAGAHGKDQKGIFRVHQFEKIEQFVFSKPEDSWNEHENMIAITEEFFQKLEIPHKVVLLSSGDMGKISAKTYDLEVWMAGQNAYREVVSCSNCLDYQSRRLKIRFRDKTNEDTKYIHTLNSTLVATERTMVAILENLQTKDGHVNIPNVLQKYMGKKII